MKLELKHLAGYLPYGLKCYSTTIILDTHTENRNYEMGLISLRGVLKGTGIPILRPLSDLKKYIGNFCFEEWVQESSCPEEYEQYTRCIYEKLYDGSVINIHYLSYRIIKKMYENHFDIYGLIEAGLAIDINTLNK